MIFTKVVNLDWTLAKLFDYLREKLTLDEKIQRRLRKLKFMKIRKI